ncbi:MULTISPECIES: phage major capsid protein [unclassified Parvimonas]|uniref:phage major capsid protein n=1 Tax=unclassified Parvimonas TaxID=1151464 RepID=UPI002B4A2602|nr:phage major capsid protein [Parvimonas sp. D9]MEB3059234.1 phage major capsid protein [Parvimonas sp. D9]
MAVLSKGTLFDPELVTDLINKVKGKSSLAVLSKQVPVSFNGNKIFTFTLDKDVDVVAENGKKSEGGVSVEPVKIIPIKIEYGARVSDEFIYAADEEKISILKAFNEGFAKKVARGIDLMAFHGLNPRTKQASDVISTNHFDSLVTQTVTFDKAQIEENIETAVAMIQGANGEVSGVAMSPIFSQELAKLKVNGVKQYPELAWGANPGTINGLPADINTTISEGDQVKDRSIIGDFANMFKWGYAKEIPLQVIEYGDPDNSGKDLKGYNQVYLRAEAFIGWGILDAKSFVRIVEA